MRTLILLVAASLVVIIRTSPPSTELKYGDLLAFRNAWFCGCVTFKHFAIYLDGKTFPGQKAGEDIFHFIGPDGCFFGKLDLEGEYEVYNYLDDIPMFQNKETMSEDSITKRISEMSKGCGDYSARSNNCEHLATYVRYGLKLSFQCEEGVAKIFVSNPDVDGKIRRQIKNELNALGTCKKNCGKAAKAA